MSKNLISEWKKEWSYTSDPSKCGDADPMGRGLWSAQITVIICYQIELDKLNIYETLTCSIPKMCWWLCMRFCTILSHCLSLSSAALSGARELRVDEKVEVLVRRQA
jgi:hypothetical protein